MRQIVSNLVDNALRHTPEGGAGKVTVSEDTGGATIEVADTGEGIAPEHLERIFDRFYRPDASRSRHTGGSGLGLSIIRELARLHGGNIEAESAVGEGSVFMVWLPVG